MCILYFVNIQSDDCENVDIVLTIAYPVKAGIFLEIKVAREKHSLKMPTLLCLLFCDTK